MKRLTLFLPLTILILLACTGGLAPFSTVPAASQPAAATIAPGTVQPPTGAGAGSALTGTTWMWIGFTSPNEQVAVESPVNYSVAFQTDGTVNIVADCNNALGSYQVDGQSIKLQVGPMTNAMCPAGSRSDEFVQYLGSAATYSFQDGNLFIDLPADGGTMVFAPSDVVTADQGGSALRAALQANPWQWASFANAAGQYDVDMPGNYLLTFHENGTVDIKADCNNASGTYTIDGIKISIQVGPMTLAACPPGSRSDEFLKDLGSAETYFYQPGELFIDLTAEGGTMRFTPVVTGN
jgi:heat shock protein HslJ